jgi:predicted ATP-dependent serine protease
MSREQLTSTPAVVCLNEVEARGVTWLWAPWIPFGKLTGVDGDPEVGKSALLLDLAARVSAGAPMPDGTPGLSAGVCIASAEDGLADTVRARLLAAGADLTRAHSLTSVCDDQSVQRPLELPLDVGALEKVLVERQCRLLVVDPLAAFLGRGANAQNEQSMRRCLHLLAEMAARTGCAVVLVRHLKS